MWALVALASAAIFAVTSIVDKHVLDRRFPSVVSFYVWLALQHLVFVGIVLAATGIPRDASAENLLIAFSSGLCLGAGFAFLFFGLKLEEVSRANAITEVYPVYVALLAVAFLGEVLDPVQWVAILLVVMGAILVSLRGGSGGGLPRWSRGMPFLLATGIGQGLGYFTLKHALGDLPIWTVFAFQQMGLMLMFGLYARPRAWRELVSVYRDKRFLLVMSAKGVLAFFAIALSIWAVSLGPVSLVVAMMATRPLFVFAGSSILSNRRWHLLDESVAPATLAYKAASITIIVVGAVTLGLS